MKTYICPVCGYDGLDEEPYGKNFNPSYNICECCGFEYGYSEDHDVDLGYILAPNEMKEAIFQLYRKQWIEGGAVVRFPDDYPTKYQKNGIVKPEMLIKQLRRLNIDLDNLDFLDEFEF